MDHEEVTRGDDVVTDERDGDAVQRRAEDMDGENATKLADIIVQIEQAEARLIAAERQAAVLERGIPLSQADAVFRLAVSYLPDVEGQDFQAALNRAIDALAGMTRGTGSDTANGVHRRMNDSNDESNDHTKDAHGQKNASFETCMIGSEAAVPPLARAVAPSRGETGQRWSEMSLGERATLFRNDPTLARQLAAADGERLGR